MDVKGVMLSRIVIEAQNICYFKWLCCALQRNVTLESPMLLGVMDDIQEVKFMVPKSYFNQWSHLNSGCCIFHRATVRNKIEHRTPILSRFPDWNLVPIWVSAESAKSQAGHSRKGGKQTAEIISIAGMSAPKEKKTGNTSFMLIDIIRVLLRRVVSNKL